MAVPLQETPGVLAINEIGGLGLVRCTDSVILAPIAEPLYISLGCSTAGFGIGVKLLCDGVLASLNLLHQHTEKYTGV